ncbi:MAG: hypothetical protein JW822_08380 [Spirochaetales bacterium]|nr:hypothetical protein [Spirochaetales bacterium]
MAGVGQPPSSGVMAISPWCHGLYMAPVWSVLAALASVLISRSFRMSLGIGFVVFIHWILDFITHPMGVVFGGEPLPPNLPLFLKDHRESDSVCITTHLLSF